MNSRFHLQIVYGLWDMISLATRLIPYWSNLNNSVFWLHVSNALANPHLKIRKKKFAIYSFAFFDLYRAAFTFHSEMSV